MIQMLMGQYSAVIIGEQRQQSLIGLQEVVCAPGMSREEA